MKFRPLHGRVVIRRMEGDAIEICPGSRDESGKLIPLDVRAGDTVLFGKWSGTEARSDGGDIPKKTEADIMGVVEKTEATTRTIA